MDVMQGTCIIVFFYKIPGHISGDSLIKSPCLQAYSTSFRHCQSTDINFCISRTYVCMYVCTPLNYISVCVLVAVCMYVCMYACPQRHPKWRRRRRRTVKVTSQRRSPSRKSLHFTRRLRRAPAQKERLSIEPDLSRLTCQVRRHNYYNDSPAAEQIIKLALCVCVCVCVCVCACVCVCVCVRI